MRCELLGSAGSHPPGQAHRQSCWSWWRVLCSHLEMLGSFLLWEKHADNSSSNSIYLQVTWTSEILYVLKEYWKRKLQTKLHIPQFPKSKILTLPRPKVFELLVKIKTSILFFLCVHTPDTLEYSVSMWQRASWIIKRQFADSLSHYGMRLTQLWAQNQDRWQDLQLIPGKVLTGKVDSQNFRYWKFYWPISLQIIIFTDPRNQGVCHSFNF